MRKPSDTAMRPQDKGFYMILILCIAAVAIAGYVLFADGTSANKASAGYTYTADGGADTAGAQTQQPEVPAMKTEPAEKSEQTETKSASAADDADAAKKSTAAQSFSAPMAGTVLHSFSDDTLTYDKTMADWRVHQGIDYTGKEGDAVKAISAGTVTETDTNSMYGTYVKIAHADGLVSFYAGLKNVTVKKGDTVATGTVIASLGEAMPAESADGVHLHVEMTKDGERIDPAGLYAAPDDKSDSDE